MTQVLVNEASLQDIADAIREKNGTEEIYLPSEMAPAIMALEVVPPKSWFGDGSDGDFVVAAGETHSEPVTLDEGMIIKQYSSLTIEEGGIWQPANRCNMTKILVSGDLTVNGSMVFDRLMPLQNSSESEVLKDEHWNLCNTYQTLKGGNGGTAGAGGYSGGNGGVQGAAGTGGNGFELGGGCGGGSGGICWRQYSNTYGSTGTAYPGASGEPRPPIGTAIPYAATAKNSSPLYGVGGSVTGGSYTYNGGSGPGGSGGILRNYGSNTTDQFGGGKAGTAGSALGGGCAIIFVGGKVKIGATGVISADGGNGARGVGINSATKFASGGCGGGGGGIIAIIHNGDYINSGSVRANGGTGGAIAVSSVGSAGSDGDAGTVLIAAIADILG